MREPDQAEFTERIDRPILSHTAVRGGIVLGSALLFAVGVLSVMGASPCASTGADPSTGADRRPAPSTAPASPNATNPTNPNGEPANGGLRHGRGRGFLRGFGMGFGGGPGRRLRRGDHHRDQRFGPVAQDRRRLDADDHRHGRYDHHPGRDHDRRR